MSLRQLGRLDILVSAIHCLCRLHDITIQAWSPLQHGMFKGMFIDNPDFPELNEVLGDLAEQYGVTKSAIAIAWILRHPAKMQVIVGTMNPTHLEEMAQADGINLTHEEWVQPGGFWSF